MNNLPLWEAPKFKKLIIETAKLLQRHYTFREIAELFYRAGIIKVPENPYPDYEGNKYDYAVEKLASGKDVRIFFREILPEVFASIDVEYSDAETSSLVWAAKKVGYKIDRIERTFELPDGDGFTDEFRDLVPPQELAKTTEKIIEEQVFISKSSSFPNELNDLLDQLNKVVSTKCYDAAAFLIRRIVFLASVIYAEKLKFNEELLKESGDYKDLSKILGIVGTKNADVSSQLLSRVRATKWMGDYANHNRKWKAEESEILASLTNLRAYLAALY